VSSHSSHTTTDHKEIRKWAQARGAKPARVKGTGNKTDEGMIRLDFPGYSGGGSLEEISWDDWFHAFDENGLALVYQDKTAEGERSNFNKLIARDSANAREHGNSHASKHHGTTGSASSRSRASSSSSRTSSRTTSRTSSRSPSSSAKKRTTAQRASGGSERSHHGRSGGRSK
jgi:hypothetical protein